MGLLSLLRKDQQESDPDDSGFYSRAEEVAEPSRARGRKKQGSSNPSSQPLDPVLPEKKRARRRLVGAVALVLVLIIGLPMILDAEPKTVADDITIKIPSKDAPENRSTPRRPSSSMHMLPPGLDSGEEVIDIPPPGQRPSLSASAAPESQISAKTSANTQDTLKPSIDKVSLATATDGKTSVGDANVDSGPGKVTIPSKNASARTVSTPPEVREAIPTPASKLVSGKTLGDKKDVGDEKKSGRIVMQVAAFASPQKVSDLQRKLTAAGIRSYTQKVATESGERIRIRTGPYGSKEAADKDRAKLDALGLRGTVVAN